MSQIKLITNLVNTRSLERFSEYICLLVIGADKVVVISPKRTFCLTKWRSIYVFSPFMKDLLWSNVDSGLTVTNKFRREDSLSMEIYTYANCERSITNKIFTYSYCVFLCVNLVTRRSKHNVVAQSSAEAKFQAMWRIVEEN